MKKIATWMTVISISTFVVVWSLIGLKIFDNEYDFVMEAYIAYGSLAVFFVGLIYLKSTQLCPHCGKLKTSFGKYCPHCGKEIR